MESEHVANLVEQAVARRFGEWAAEHPALAGVINQLTLMEQTAESLRATPQYQQAVAAYHQARCEQTLMAQLLDLAGVALAAVLK